MKNAKHPIVYHPSYDIPLPENHRFPGTKYSALIKELESTGLIEHYLKYVPKPTTSKYLSIAHDPVYIRSIETGNLSKEQQTKLGLPWSETLRQRSFLSPNGTLLAAQLALQTGVACHAAGGTHHAHWDFGAGFCVFNDLAYAARALIGMKLAKRILIFDCDVHQGDGTARILSKDKNIFTCSIHCAENYPAEKAKSDLDFSIIKGSGDEDYLAALRQCLSEIDQTNFSPDLVIYDAAVDVHGQDKLGLLEMTSEGIEQRDQDILSHFKERQVPITTTIGGGYGASHEEVAKRHSIVFAAVKSIFCN
jgi:acetoin utilization deacetylase AcuC-like enzyme